MLKKYLFHPFEISFCGFSGSGKTTLITKLIKDFSQELSVGYFKHDAHKFQMDRPEKDTYKSYEAGASKVLITSNEKWAEINKGPIDLATEKSAFLDFDMLIVEGYKNSSAEKFFFIKEGETFNPDLYENVIGVIGTQNQPPEGLGKIPYFERNEISKITKHIKGIFSERISKTPLYGLILAGGKSSRMKKDKGAIDYFGKSQTAHLYELISPFCQETYVSCRSDQKDQAHLKRFPLVKDQFLEMGPMGGILSALKSKPMASWLVVACDLPFLNTETLKNLIEKRNPYKNATCYLNPQRGWPEPLCTIYESKSYQRLLQFMGMGYSCPRKVLFNSEIQALKLEDHKSLRNINHPEEYQNAMGELYAN